MEFLDPKELIRTFGTIGLILIIYAESGLLLGLIFPGDSLLFTAGLLASQGKFGLNIWVLAGGAFVAAVLGAETGYTIGQKFGPTLFRRPDSKLFKQEYVDKSREFFEKHGPRSIVLARFVPFVRTLAPMFAGIGEMNRRSFFVFNVLGAFLWAFGITIAGFFLGEAIPSVDKYLLPIIALIVLISVVPPLLELRKHRRAQRQVSETDAETMAEELHEELES